MTAHFWTIWKKIRVLAVAINLNNFSIGNSRALSKTVNLSRGLDPINKSKFVNHAMLILRIPIGCSYDFNQSECSILP